MEEFNRVLRHFGPVIATWLVAKGYIPPEVGGPLTDLLVTAMVALSAYGFSKARDVKRK
jgi:hypothetical protein